MPEAAKLLNVSTDTLKRWIKKGQIRAIQTIGGHHRIPRSEIERLTSVAPADDHEPPGCEPPKTLKPRVLIVEDSPETLEFLEHYVGTVLGYEIASAANCVQGLNLARTGDFDLYLLDNWLPDGRGTTLCQSIREMDPLTPIVFYSSIVAGDEKIRAIEAGAQAYIEKPHYDALKATLDKYLGESAPRESRDPEKKCLPFQLRLKM